MFYGQKVIKRLVENVNNNEPSSKNILEAIKMFAKVWRSVTPQIISNCLVIAGFKDSDS